MEQRQAIRVLHVLTAMNRGGTETLLMNLYRSIDKSKIQFDFAVSETSKGDYDDEIEAMGGKIIHYPRYKGKNHFAYKKWWRGFFSKNPEYKIVHGHIGSTAALYLGIAKKLGRYTIAHSHSTNTIISVHALIYKLYSYPTRYVADYFFGCSRQALVDRYGRRIANNNQKSRVFNNAIDAAKFAYNQGMREKIRKAYGVADDTIVIGTVGRLTLPKNPWETIRICEELKRRKINYVFWWFGTGELKERIIESVLKKNLSEYIFLYGTSPNIYDVLQGMDIFLFPSLWEGLGIACVEAQAAGLPTLCSDTIPQEAKVTELGKFLPLGKTEIWCDEIEKIITEISVDEYSRPNTYQSIVNAGYEISEVAHDLEEFYLSKIE